MKNTKQLIAIMIAVVMVVACVFVLAACDNHKCESKCETCGKCTNKDCTESACKDKCEGHGSSADSIPTEDGKVTLYWNVKHDTGLTNITSYFLCGTPNSWTQGNTDYEFKRLGETNTYYVFMDSATATGAEYKVLIGYNSNSPVDTAAQGPFWANESYGKTWAAGGANSTVPEFTGNTVDCGTIEFEGCLGDPVAVTNFDVKVSFVKGVLNENSVVYIMGHFSSWANTPNDPAIKAVKDTDPDNATNLDVYKIHVDQMYAKSNAEYLVLVFPNGLGEEITKDSGTVEVWDYFNRANSGGIQICSPAMDNGELKKNNSIIAVDDLSTDNYLEIGNTISTGSNARGIDLANKVENKDADENGLGNYYLDIATVLPEVEITFTVTFTTAIPTDRVVYIAGSGLTGLTWDAGTLKMTTTDNKTFTVTVTVRMETSFEYKVVVGSATALDWDHSYGDGDGNAQGKITEAGNYELFEDALVYTA